MAIFSSLNRQQKEAVGLLQIGTFLEYFDLMLYVHMAVLLNELFFPKTDPHTAALLTAFAFCSTFVFRPVGALVFGYIGDNIGRKTTVIITSMMMSISCVIMANLPTYAEIGIGAAWIVTICRVLQGMSSLGEVIGAEIYVTEIVKPPMRYSAVGFIACASALGSVIALTTASFVTTSGFNWRIAFWIGATIAVIGYVARTSLRETPDFVDAKRRMKRAIESSNRDGLESVTKLLISTNPVWKEKVNKKTILAYFLLSCGWPVCFFFSYIYCGNVLRNTFGYTAEQVIHQNLILAIVEFISFLFLSFLVRHIHPLNVLKTKFFVFFPLALLLPWILDNIGNSNNLLYLQLFSVLFMVTDVPAGGVIYIHFPVLKRFTYTSFLHAISRSFAYILTSFGLIYLTDWAGHYGLLVIMVPACISFYWGVLHFEKLEKKFAAHA